MYAEAYVSVNQFDIILDVLVVNQTADVLQGLTLELATLGDLKLMEKPQPCMLGPHDFTNIKANIKVRIACPVSLFLCSLQPSEHVFFCLGCRVQTEPVLLAVYHFSRFVFCPSVVWPVLVHPCIYPCLGKTKQIDNLILTLFLLSVQVASTENGIIFGNIVYDVGSSQADRCCVVLSNIHIDIMDYLSPASCTEQEFRQMWADFEWENKVSLEV